MNRRHLIKLISAQAAAVGCLPIASAAAHFDNVQGEHGADPIGDFKPTLSERITDFILRARYEDLPASVVQKTKEQLTFFLGRALEGVTCDEGTQFVEVVRKYGSPGNATIIGHSLRGSPSDAAGVNCSLMRGSTRDDVIWPAGVHAGVVAIPPALAIAETCERSGRELILAVALGYEVMGKLARAANGWTSRLPRRPTNIYGAYGPVVTAGRLLGLDRARLENAVGYAPNVAMGIPEGGMMTHYYSLIAQSGTFAAGVAAAGGATYSRKTIEGENGLYRSFFGEIPSELPKHIASLGQNWEILTAEQKRHHGTGQNTPAIELLLDLMKNEGLDAENFDRIEVVLDFEGSDLRKDAVASRGPFKRAVDAYSSLPYAFALNLLMKGKVDAKWYADEAHNRIFNDAAVAKIMKRISLRFEAGHSPRYAKVMAVRRGKIISRQADHFELSFPEDAWDDWLHQYGDDVIGRQKVIALSQTLKGLETSNVRDLMAAARL